MGEEGPATTEGTAPPGTVADDHGLAERVNDALAITDWRALVVIVVAPPGLGPAVDRALQVVRQTHAISEVQFVRYTAQRDEAGRSRLSAINRARDELLRSKRLIWLHAASAADVRFLRETAPDLLSTIDLLVELRPEEDTDWLACRRQIRELMKRQHAMLDFTGLLPASVEQRQIPLNELYLPLVDLDSAVLGEARGEGQPPGLLFLGHPGTGKTTFVRHLAWTYAGRMDDPLGIGEKVPLLIPLSDYGFFREHDRALSLVDYLPHWLEDHGISGTSAITQNLSDVLLLLDGLDEMRSPDARRSTIAEASDLLRQGRLGGVVITGRSFLVDELALRGKDDAFHLIASREPSSRQIRNFLANFIRLRRGSHQHPAELISRIEGDPDLRALARTPLMLAFMAILDELEGRLPDRRIEIYYRLGEMLVDRWTRARSIGTVSHRAERPTRADAFRVLGPLAWWTVDRGGGSIPEAALARELQRIEAKRETAPEAEARARALLDLLRSDTALLVPRPGRRWSFVHGSIGEYFAGVEAERDRQRWAALLDDPFSSEWREIVLFCAGQLGVIEGRVDSLDALIAAILKKGRRAGRYDAKYPSLLMGLLQESPGLSKRQVSRLTKRLLEFVLTTAFSPTAARQVQTEFVSLLHAVHGSVAQQLHDSMSSWFSERARDIDWDRLMRAAPDEYDEQSLLTRFGHYDCLFILDHFVLGPFITSLHQPWRKRYGIELEPTRSRWRSHSDWRYRYAEIVCRDDFVPHARFSDVVEAVREQDLEITR